MFIFLSYPLEDCVLLPFGPFGSSLWKQKYELQGKSSALYPGFDFHHPFLGPFSVGGWPKKIFGTQVTTG